MKLPRGKPLLMMRTRGIAGPYFRHHARIPRLSRSTGNYVGTVGAGAKLLSGSVTSPADEIDLIFNGSVTATTPECGWTYSINGGVDTAPVGGAINGNTLTLLMAAPVVAKDVITVSYDGTLCDLAVDGDPLEEVTDFQVVNGVESLPEYVSGRVYESAGGEQRVEITFNTGMKYLNFNGATIKADGVPRAITGITGQNTTKLTYITSGINDQNTVTWEYSEVAGNLTNLSGKPLGDVLPQTLGNEVGFETHWDAIYPDPMTTTWDDPDFYDPNATHWDKA